MLRGQTQVQLAGGPGLKVLGFGFRLGWVLVEILSNMMMLNIHVLGPGIHKNVSWFIQLEAWENDEASKGGQPGGDRDAFMAEIKYWGYIGVI